MGVTISYLQNGAKAPGGQLRLQQKRLLDECLESRLAGIGLVSQEAHVRVEVINRILNGRATQAPSPLCLLRASTN